MKDHWIGRHIHVSGIVQGVGFRPFVYNLAKTYGLGGWVLNTSAGVDIAVYGFATAVEQFVQALQSELPPLAVIDDLVQAAVSVPSTTEFGTDFSPYFLIRTSAARERAFVPVSPDIATCPECLSEVLSPDDRRYLYPFANCTNCGPRFTIIEDIPYDRATTTMSKFDMCPACLAEYTDPSNRRFHAQPNACPECGPHVSLAWTTSDAEIVARNASALGLAQAALRNGKILAIKGLGGYHLACDATNDHVVQTLRQRKQRSEKPFAVMAANLEIAQKLARISPEEKALLLSKERPIVILDKRQDVSADISLSPSVAPGNATVGIMLPYTPLHHLLFLPLTPDGIPADFAADTPAACPLLVMTSGNLSEEPIVSDDGEARIRLGPLVDGILSHNRPIHVPCDDSVVRVFQNRELPIRRSRGYAPFPVRLPFLASPSLAVGAELKNTFCLAQDRYAFMSQHIGDMENLETLHAFEHAIEHMQNLFRVDPAYLACDLHPAYLSTRWAERRAQERGLPLYRIQHHHAHVASVLAENGIAHPTPVIGLAFDGTGYGPDGAIWGGEVFIATYGTYERIAHLRPVPLPGGDIAIKNPFRMALAHLWRAGIPWDEDLLPVQACRPVERSIIQAQLKRGINSVPTTSIGRLFDAVAALAGVRQTVTYEAQAAIEFETMADPSVEAAYTFDICSVARPAMVFPAERHGLQSRDSDLQFEIDAARLIAAVVKDVRDHVAPSIVSAKFHNALVELVVAMALRIRSVRQIEKVALTGGVFQNTRLLFPLFARLEQHGFEVLTQQRLPPNDGGLALGQAAIAHFLAESERT